MSAPVLAARHAMAARFEAVLHGRRPEALRAAAEEALDEVERLDTLLSFYRPLSEVSRVNSRAAFAPVAVSPVLFSLLKTAARLHAETAGAFDVTVGPLLRTWGIIGRQGRAPTEAERQTARDNTGMRWVELDESALAVRFHRPGLMIDLGAIGKGFALDRAGEILREAGVESALLHGGTSSVLAIGAPPGHDAWRVGVAAPSADPAAPAPLLATASLRDQSLAVSAPASQPLAAAGESYGHVVDPRTGRPAPAALAAAVVLPGCAEADALSTALVVLGHQGIGILRAARPESSLLLADAAAPSARTLTGSAFCPLDDDRPPLSPSPI